jgi:hypothetical protein
LDAEISVFLPEIADYEIRRNLIVENLTGSLANLDALPSFITYVPITTADMRQAAKLWAQSRKSGRSGRRKGAERGRNSRRTSTAPGMHHRDRQRWSPRPVHRCSPLVIDQTVT